MPDKGESTILEQQCRPGKYKTRHGCELDTNSTLDLGSLHDLDREHRLIRPPGRPAFQLVRANGGQVRLGSKRQLGLSLQARIVRDDEDYAAVSADLGV